MTPTTERQYVAPGPVGFQQTARAIATRAARLAVDPRNQHLARHLVKDAPAHDQRAEAEALYKVASGLSEWTLPDGRSGRVRYAREAGETIPEPEQFLARGGDDCDGQTLFLATMLRALGHHPTVVLVEAGDAWHVYVRDELTDGTTIPCDATYPDKGFGWEYDGGNRWEYRVSEGGWLARLFEGARNVFGLAGVGDRLGAFTESDVTFQHAGKKYSRREWERITYAAAITRGEDLAEVRRHYNLWWQGNPTENPTLAAGLVRDLLLIGEYGRADQLQRDLNAAAGDPDRPIIQYWHLGKRWNRAEWRSNLANANKAEWHHDKIRRDFDPTVSGETSTLLDWPDLARQHLGDLDASWHHNRAHNLASALGMTPPVPTAGQIAEAPETARSVALGGAVTARGLAITLLGVAALIAYGGRRRGRAA